MACQLTPDHSLTIGNDLQFPDPLGIDPLLPDTAMDMIPISPTSPLNMDQLCEEKKKLAENERSQTATTPDKRIHTISNGVKQEVPTSQVTAPAFTLSGPPATTSITGNIEAGVDSRSKDFIHPSRMVRRGENWKTVIKNSTNFDLFAPGLITLLDFDGIELWAMDGKTGDVVNIADTVRDESLLKWSWDSNSWKLAAGKGMIGRVYLTGVAEWANDISKVEDSVFLRCPIAQRLRVKGVGVVPVEAPTGDQIIVFLYSKKELGFDKDKARKKFVEDMIRQWMRNCKDIVKFHSSKKSSVRMVVTRGQKGSSKIQIHKKDSNSMPPPVPKKRTTSGGRSKRRRGPGDEQDDATLPN